MLARNASRWDGAPGVTQAGAHRESYDYGGDGQLIAVTQSEAGADGVFGAPTLLASYSRDVLGRVMGEVNYAADGITVVRSRSNIVYDNRGQVLSESTAQRQGGDVYNTYSSNWYGADGLVQSSAVQSWKVGDERNATNATTTYQYLWRDGPLTSQVTLTNRDGTTQSLYGYDGAGRLLQVVLTGGQRPRTVSVATDLAGQILTRDETSAAAANPHARTYFFDGVQQGTVNNDGTDNTTFAEAVRASGVAPPTTPGPFRGGQTSGSAYASFDRQHDAVNFSSVETASSSYTVREGDTLRSIAQAAWGDANLWYMLASANGLGAVDALAPGRMLTIPNKVVNRSNTSDSFRPYDPAEALGDVQPNTPTPRPQQASKKKNKCGVFGAILLAVVAVAVTVVTAGIATPALGPVLGGAVAGAAGSAVSQVVGVATGIQDKFSFKGVALAAISGGVGGGVASVVGNGAIGGSQFLGGVVRGVASSALTQGVAVATGLQKRFDWAGVAAAGIGGGVSSAVGNALRIGPMSLSAGNIGKVTVAGMAGGIANAATRSLADGSDFGDNILAALPDVIASTVGRVIEAAVSNDTNRPGELSDIEKDLLAKAEASARAVPADLANRALEMAAAAKMSPGWEGSEEIVVTASRTSRGGSGLGEAVVQKDTDLRTEAVQANDPHLRATDGNHFPGTDGKIYAHGTTPEAQWILWGADQEDFISRFDGYVLSAGSDAVNSNLSKQLQWDGTSAGQAEAVFSALYELWQKGSSQAALLAPGVYKQIGYDRALSQTTAFNVANYQLSNTSGAPTIYQSYVAPVVNGVGSVLSGVQDTLSWHINNVIGPNSLYQQYIGQPFARAAGPYLEPPIEFALGAATDPQVGMQMVATGPAPVKAAGAGTYLVAKGYQGLSAGSKFFKGLLVEGTAAETVTTRSLSYQLGQAGEFISAEVTGLPKNTLRIPSASGAKSYRIPDHLEPLNQRYIAETKNVRYQTLTSQILDDVAHVNRSGYPGRVDVIVDSRTSISGPLLREHLNPGSPIKIRTVDLNFR